MEIVPFSSIGALTFGDTREDARAKLGADYSMFAKDGGANETDAFDDSGLHLYYDDAGKLEFVEAFEPAEIVFREIHFLGRDIASVVRDMNAAGFAENYSDVGVKFPEAGIAIFAPSEIIEGVAAHRKGYYE